MSQPRCYVDYVRSDELRLFEQVILRCRIARRLGYAEVAEGVRREHAPARGALNEALLDQIGLDDVLDGVARLGQRRRDRLDADRAATKRGRGQSKILTV